MTRGRLSMIGNGSVNMPLEGFLLSSECGLGGLFWMIAGSGTYPT